MLSQSDLDWYAARLAIAVYDTNAEYQMSVGKLTSYPAWIGGGVADATIEGLVEYKMANPFENNEKSDMSNPFDRMKEKMAKAGGVAGRVAGKIEAKADALIARETELDAKAESAFAIHDAIMESAHGALDEIEGAVNILSNNPPA